MANYATFKGAPFNLRSFRLHQTKRGSKWQWWNCKVNRWCNFAGAGRFANEEEARAGIAQWCYGCEPGALTFIKS